MRCIKCKEKTYSIKIDSDHRHLCPKCYYEENPKSQQKTNKC